MGEASRISKMFSFQVSNELDKYLGVPLLHDRVNKDIYHYILKKINQKLFDWNANLISFAGRLTLVKSVLMIIPTYAMQTTALPKSLCDHIEAVVRKFL